MAGWLRFAGLLSSLSFAIESLVTLKPEGVTEDVSVPK
jgi:hypothetical protein